ncbi:MAG TPA: hypothetical protein DCL61_12290 [Cyanobacteria bacterium UBA12227]|nr:hypothetical protein [Cyanobacteria bacterium UBA12227]HAX89140.1 hypothetical protein [Cyanobacteria bacterium UBA11370]HBY77257.1 hypothetical protein [Cyanobacteria bacterium UBA11148]
MADDRFSDSESGILLRPNTQSQLTESSKVAINGIGPIRVGMTVKEAENSADIKLIREEIGAHENCSYVKPQTGPSGVEFMVIDDRIARVNIYENPRITTVGGAKIGDTEERIKSLYPGQIEVSPHEYVPGGHYLTFVPKDSQDQQYRVVFETDGKRVTDFRAGRIPEVEYVEGCV